MNYFWEGFEKRASTALMRRITSKLTAAGKAGLEKGTPKAWSREPVYQSMKRVLSKEEGVKSRKQMLSGLLRQD